VGVLFARVGPIELVHQAPQIALSQTTIELVYFSARKQIVCGAVVSCVGG